MLLIFFLHIIIILNSFHEPNYDKEKLFEWAIYLQSLRSFSFLFSFLSSLLVCSFFSSFLPACGSFSFVLFFFFLLDFSSRVTLAPKVLYSASDSLFGRFYGRLFKLDTMPWWHAWPQAPNFIMLHSHIHDTYTCRNKTNNNDERTNFFRKIHLSHFIRNGCERFKCERWVGDWTNCNILTPSSAVFSSTSFSFCWAAQSEVPGPIALCWVLVLSTASYLQLTDSN